MSEGRVSGEERSNAIARLSHRLTCERDAIRAMPPTPVREADADALDRVIAALNSTPETRGDGREWTLARRHGGWHVIPEGTPAAGFRERGYEVVTVRECEPAPDPETRGDIWTHAGKCTTTCQCSTPCAAERGDPHGGACQRGHGLYPASSNRASAPDPTPEQKEESNE